ncbi:TPA: ead/Ea22-like family protein [Klebsiella pneumoniae]|uniref:ead/Ea22-like family protein n=1 Tax=Klebsiella variicola TaxID=244366 RepID=UPI0007CA66BB|nr:ead/Ea22-like family protein [Klebsiella variicola]HBS7233851.1 ead/Ea22-like family protein [Klebsiella pneumoniae]SAR12463.1 Ead domain protein [Klebsiella variicola]SAU70660.1 Ead domain protein [Klebsiella variicola]HBW1190645.1 ead/Ea22-like family protein [Klebsiella pneumoniae]HBW4459775.1 ead/Ea22-like family protein [Klebsiella pneumoniae]
MTDITELAQRMKAAAEKATPGEWWADEVKNEGCYGSGDDCVEGFTSYAIYGSDGQTLFDSLNSDAACICEEYDGEGHVAWDETAQRNAEFIALANPANVLALVEALEKAQQKIDELENDEVRQRLANAEHQLYMAELAKHNLKASRKSQFRKRRAAEKRIAELESRLNSADKLQDSAFRSGLQHGFSLGQTDDQKGYEQSMAAYSSHAGIKVEDE